MSRLISLPTTPRTAVSRRRFLQVAVGGALGFAASPVLADFTEYRALSFVHVETGETLDATYYQHGTYHPRTLARVAFLMRDFHSGDVHQIDPMLLDALFELKVRADFAGRFQMISGYRSPLTNEQLRQHNHVVAEHSMHVHGKAVDIRASGVSTKKLRNLAVAMNRGGVGYYPSANSIHLDTGRLRTW
jgi:uncharacterized protein YcbK (DUF882 family)